MKDLRDLTVDGWSRMSEITEEGVSVVENLELERQPMPSTEAIYLISPTVSSYVHHSLTTSAQSGAKSSFFRPWIFTEPLRNPVQR